MNLDNENLNTETSDKLNLLLNEFIDNVSNNNEINDINSQYYKMYIVTTHVWNLLDHLVSINQMNCHPEKAFQNDYLNGLESAVKNIVRE